MDQPQSTIPPLTPPSKKTVLRSSVVLIIALVIALGLFLYLSAPAQEALSAWTLPSALRTAQFISYADGGAVYGVSALGYEKQERRMPPEVASVFGNEWNTATRKGQWVVSPNKTQVAFTELMVPHQPTLPLSWQVSVADARTGSQKAVGRGFGVVFVDEKHVARLTETGIIVTNLEEGTEATVLPLTLTKVPDTVSVSPNGALMAWSMPEEHAIVVYSLSHDTATLVTKYLGLFDTFTLANDALYLMRVADMGTTVLRYPLAENATEAKLHTLPASLNVTRMAVE